VFDRDPIIPQSTNSGLSPAETHDVQHLVPLSLLVLATTLEASGDAIIRIGLGPHSFLARAAFMLAGAVILYGYGLTLNLGPLDGDA